MTKNTLKNVCILKQCLGTKMGNIFLTSTVIADVELTIHEKQVCKNTNNSKKLDKGIKEQGNDKKLLYVQNKDYILRVMIFSCNSFLIKKHIKHL